MANNRGPTNRSRFSVPISPGKPPKHQPRRRGAQQQSHFGGETNRALINGGILVVATLATTVLLLAISGQIYDTTNVSFIAQSPAPLPSGIISTPTVPPTATRATPTPQPTRAVVTASPTESPSPAATPDDTEIQAAIDKRLGSDSSLSAMGITATVTDGKVILVGTAPSDELKARIEKLVRSIRGVRQVENQIAVITN